MLRVDDALLLPFEAALPVVLPLPPPVKAPLNHQERYELFVWRADSGFQLWHPDDNFDASPLVKDGFMGERRTKNSNDVKCPAFSNTDVVAAAIWLREEKGMPKWEREADEFARKVMLREKKGAA